MRFVLLIVLLIVSCGDANKKKPMPETIEWSAYDESKPYTKLSYSNSLDIMLVESTFKNVQECILERNFTRRTYEAVYWDSNNNAYYLVTNKRTFGNPIPVADTNFVYALNNPNQIEPVFYPRYQEIFTNTGARLLYVGDLSSPMERVYLDPTNQVYYIKYLTFWDTSIYESQPYTDDRIYQTNTTPPIYPAMYTNIFTYRSGKKELIISLLYTNENKQEFIIPTTDIFGDDTFYMPILYSGGYTVLYD